jgi:hypothetical protein
MATPAREYFLRFGSEYVVSRQRTPDTLERKFANGLDCDSNLDRHQNARADKDLTGLGLIAKPRGDIGYRPDGSIIEAVWTLRTSERSYRPIRSALPRPCNGAVDS